MTEAVLPEPPTPSANSGSSASGIRMAAVSPSIPRMGRLTVTDARRSTMIAAYGSMWSETRCQ